MVKICSLTAYPKENQEKYQCYFEKYEYPLHIFQKFSIEAIVEGHHILATAPTGSGKTLPGEFSIDYFHSKGKKVIYTTPIKALSNQKFYDFTNKYKDISIGLITGDIKTNPDADVLIMTTEILLNKLFQIKSNNSTRIPESSISFEMDIEAELGCVVFDEIHMINDQSRGHVWEQCIMLLPKHIQMIGLSATLDNPERFALWLENKGVFSENPEKIVYLASKKDRAVPLTHYGFITTTTGIFKAVKDKSVQEEIKAFINKPFVLQNSKGEFDELQYSKMNKMMKLFENNNVRMKRQHVLNQVTKHLVENEMLPALCYVFSRKQLEVCANEVTTNLLEFDNKTPYIIDRECEHIIRKLPNYQEYLNLPEYINMVTLLRKGIAIHHSGVTPVLREMVELLFVKGFIKLLFCTETMSVGINMPVKTTIFTDVCKFDGENNRMLYSHEYTQAAGRAGRLGLDTVGHVIHLNNLFRNVETMTSYKTMMSGKPPTLKSKFKISYNLLLNLIDIGDNNFINFARKSMVKDDLDSELKEIYYAISREQMKLDALETTMKTTRTPATVIHEYLKLIESQKIAVNKKRKEIERQIETIRDQYVNIEFDKVKVENYNQKLKTIDDLQDQYNFVEKFIDNNVQTIVNLLQDDGFVQLESEDNHSISEASSSKLSLTTRGMIATHLKESHCLVFSRVFEENIFDTLNPIQIVMLLSCLTNIVVKDEHKNYIPKTDDISVKEIIFRVKNMYNDYITKETNLNINSGIEYTFHYDLINYVDKWCFCANDQECKALLQKLADEKEIFLGEFVKALLKINNISGELEKIAELIGNMSLLSKLKEIPIMTLKYVVTNQSLYV
jgi:superfamily II RNA helicase